MSPRTQTMTMKGEKSYKLLVVAEFFYVVCVDKFSREAICFVREIMNRRAQRI